MAENKEILIASELLASISILEILPTIQQKVEFAGRAIKTVIGLTGSGFCVKGYLPSSPMDVACPGCSFKDEKRINEPFDCPLQKSANLRLIPLSTSETFFGYFMIPGEFAEQIIQYEHLLLNFLTILTISIDNLLKRHDLEKLNVTLHQSEEKYHTLFTQMLDGFALHEVICDEAGKPIDYRFLEMNPAFERMTGLNAERLLGKRVLEVMPKTEKYWIETYGQVALTGNPVSFENYSVELGKYFRVLAFSNKNGQFVTVFEDITVRKRAEEALQESESRSKAMYQAIPDLIFRLDRQGVFLDYKADNKDLYTPANQTIIGEHVRDITPPEFADLIDQQIFATLQSGALQTFEYQLPNMVQGMRDYEARMVASGADEVTAIVRDITDRKLVEEKIREKDIQFRKLSANVPDLIFQFTRRPDGTYCVPVASEGIKNIFGCSPEDVLDDFTPIGRVIFPEDAARVISDIEYSAKHLSYFTCEFRVQIPGKDIQWIFSRSTPEKLNDGNITWYGFNIDITERKKAEAEIKCKNEELLKLNTEKDKFFSIIAHDLRSPFNSLLGFTALLEKELPTMSRDQIQKIAVTMRKSATNLYALLENLLEWSCLQRGLTTYNPKPILLMPKVLADTVFVMESANKKEIEINYDIPEDLKVYADENMLSSILRNLASNAVKFTPKGGKVTISAKSLDNTVECSVSDTGIGMSKEMVENIFKLDIDTSRKGTDNEPSTGLGLILCKEFVGKHGGKLWVESEEGKGSTFYFTLSETNQKEPLTISKDIPLDLKEH